ncbi:MAG: hypothetical protein ACI9ZT_001133 [Gammaproteobacteria bacterium]|jgi:hypothetical protein
MSVLYLETFKAHHYTQNSSLRIKLFLYVFSRELFQENIG